ncbi:radical SAM protein [Burkholderiaceae bacterium DAT-1]|nr:radical SAM protein [Burkholderiaceae bacterium DAT-1]
MQLSLMLTWACDIRCAHCSQAHLKTHLDLELSTRLIRDMVEQGVVDRIGFTGGEPFLRYRQMLSLAEVCAELDMPFGVVTNARWALKREQAVSRIETLARLGLTTVVISYDPYHAEHVPDQAIQNLVDVAQSNGLVLTFFYSRGDNKPVPELQAEVASRFGILPEQVIYRDVVPVGFGSQISRSPMAQSYWEIDKACPVLDEYVVWPDGKVVPCCTSGTHEHLEIANIHEHTAMEIIALRRKHGVMRRLATQGLDDIVAHLPEAHQQRIASQTYVSTCHLCHEIMGNDEAFRVISELPYVRMDLVDQLLLTDSVSGQLKQTQQPARSWKGPPLILVSEI